jgi:Putative peptidoglycan binding domain
MRKLILTTASVLALSLAAGGAYAQGPAGSSAQPAAQPQSGMSTGAQTDMTKSPQGDASMAQQNDLKAPQATENQNQSQAMQDQNPGATANMSKAQVKQLQERLRAEGLYRGRIDGVLGPKTKQAMDEAQQKSGAENNSTVGEGSSPPPANDQDNGAQNMQPNSQAPSEGAFNNPGTGTNNNNGAGASYRK